MSRYFDEAFEELMLWEGGSRFHKVLGDQGGATKYGISLRFLKGLPPEVSDIDRDGHITEMDIAALTAEEAKGFCYKYFWAHYQLGVYNSPAVATKLLNILFNMRSRVAGRVAQRALACCKVDGIIEDGILGPRSQAAINQVSCDTSLTAMFLSTLRAQQEGVYRLIVAHNPLQHKFLEGWVRRARD